MILLIVKGNCYTFCYKTIANKLLIIWRLKSHIASKLIDEDSESGQCKEHMFIR